MTLVLKILLAVFLYLAIGHILSKAIFDSFQKPTLLYYLAWPILGIFYLSAAIGAIVWFTFVFSMYIISRPFEDIVLKMWVCRDSDFEDEKKNVSMVD